MSGPRPTNTLSPRHRQQQTLRQPDAPSTGSQTQTTTGTQSAEIPPAPTQPILRLRGAHTSSGPRVQWAETVVDNEGLGRKSSKVCCIYHAPRAVGESSSESSSDDSDDSSSDSDSDSDPRRVGRAGGAGHGHDDHDEGCSHHGSHNGAARRDARDQGKKRRRPSPNAYEKQPKPKPRSTDDGGTGKPRPDGESTA
ncbi:protein phosphatase inhibitor [Seiridium cupressi]